MAFLIRKEIFGAKDTGKKLQLVIKWLTVLGHLVTFNSLHSLYGVLRGLHVTLDAEQQAWNMVPSDQKSQFTSVWKQYDPVNGFHMLRDKLKNKPPPTIPYLPLFVDDLAVIEKEHPEIVNQLINFNKHAKLSEFLGRGILEYQRAGYQFAVVPIIREWLTLDLGPIPENLLNVEESINLLPPVPYELCEIATNTEAFYIPEEPEVLNLVQNDDIVRKALKNSIRVEIRKIVRKIVDSELPPLDVKTIRKKYFGSYNNVVKKYKDEKGIIGQAGKNVNINVLEGENVLIYESRHMVTLIDIYRMLRIGQLYSENNVFDPRRLGSVFIARGVEPMASQCAAQVGIDIIITDEMAS